MDELHVSLQVAVDHENLVAAWVRAGPLSHLLVMLFDVLLKKKPTQTITGPNYNAVITVFTSSVSACYRLDTQY